tara:strand:+ start:944 stop:2245 length:1302 start_codon:yes stop_codon:yes gene_type:complete
MPNYEFYAQMAQTRANRYEQQYQQAYTAAYRDLMTAYEDEVAVRSLLAEQLEIDKKNNAALLKIATSPKKSGQEKYTDLLRLRQQLLDSQLRATTATADNRLDARKIINDRYEIPASARRLMIELIQDVEGVGEGDAIDGLLVAGDRVELIIGTLETREQAEALAAEFAPQIMKAAGTAKKGSLATMDAMTGIFGLPIKTSEAIQAEKKQATDILMKESGVGLGQTGREQLILINKAITEYEANATLDEAGRLEIIAGAMQPITQLTKEDLTITPPTEQDILARAAEYYRPYGTDEFKSVMAERDMQLVKRQEAKAKAKAKAIEDKKVAEETAKQELLARLPSWGGRALKVAGDAEALTGLSLDEINNKGQPEAFGVLMVRDEKYDLPSSIAKIDAEFDDPLDRQRALSVLMADNLNKHRAKKQTEVDLTQEI